MVDSQADDSQTVGPTARWRWSTFLVGLGAGVLVVVLAVALLVVSAVLRQRHARTYTAGGEGPSSVANSVADRYLENETSATELHAEWSSSSSPIDGPLYLVRYSFGEPTGTPDLLVVVDSARAQVVATATTTPTAGDH